MPLLATLGLSDDSSCCVVVSFEFEPPPVVLPLSLSGYKQKDLHYTVHTLLKLGGVSREHL